MFGAFFTFASLEQGSETAKGQMSIGEMKAAYDLLGAHVRWLFQGKPRFSE